MATSELLKTIKRIEIKTSRLVNDLLVGQYHSAFKGQGMAFEEVRPYQFGDEIRAIDWKVTARTGDPYIKLFREERELTVMLLVDFSASQGFGSTERLKRQLVTELGATLAFSAIKNQDKVGMIGFTDGIEKHVPASKGKRHVLRVIREMVSLQAVGRGTNITQALEHLNRTQKRRAVVFLISDFQDYDYEKALKVTARKHDLIPVVITDPREMDLPNVGMLELVDNESGERVLIDTSSQSHRLTYGKLTRQEHASREQLFKRLQLDHMEISTDRDYVEALHQLFNHRRVRQWH